MITVRQNENGKSNYIQSTEVGHSVEEDKF